MIDRGTAVYRSLLRLYPIAFWRAFKDELEIDFEEGSHEAYASGGTAALLRSWAIVGRDFVVSLAVEWLRTPWIPVLAVAAVLTFSLFSVTAIKVAQWSERIQTANATVDVRRGDDLKLMILMIIGVLIPIVGTIFGSLWLLLLRRSAASRTRRRV